MRLDLNQIENEQLVLQRYSDGVRLIKPENISDDSHYAKNSLTQILKLPFNIYFLDRRSVVQLINEESAIICGFVSVKDAIGRTVKEVFQKQYATVAMVNDQKVIQTKQLQIFDESFTRLDDYTFSGIDIKFPWYQADRLIGIFGCSIVFGKRSIAETLQKILQIGLVEIKTLMN